MRKVVFNLLAVAVLTTLTALTSCDDDKAGERFLGDGVYEILYADQTQTYNMGMWTNVGTFEWWASIEEPEKSPWIISLTPESGGETTHAACVINIEPNTSGIDREAFILFKHRYISRQEVLVFRYHIKQLATTRDGQLYIVPDSQ